MSVPNPYNKAETIIDRLINKNVRINLGDESKIFSDIVLQKKNFFFKKKKKPPCCVPKKNPHKKKKTPPKRITTPPHPSFFFNLKKIKKFKK